MNGTRVARIVRIWQEQDRLDRKRLRAINDLGRRSGIDQQDIDRVADRRQNLAQRGRECGTVATGRDQHAPLFMRYEDGYIFAGTKYGYLSARPGINPPPDEEDRHEQSEGESRAKPERNRTSICRVRSVIH